MNEKKETPILLNPKGYPKCTLCGNEVIPTVIGRNKEERTAAFGHAAVKHIEKVHPELFKPLPVLNATFNGFYVASHFEIPEGSELWDEIENTRTLLIDVVMKGAPEDDEGEDEDEEGEDEGEDIEAEFEMLPATTKPSIDEIG